ncbi:MAG TPA: SAP domain-containing protein [Lentisphaeria bacterium]|nr:MAG: hypothetical protein A2X48_03550 [Lentisphaerae bacterium GWF2_49_21]HBC85879.1 SAP domain-containing protein [Lentisphaeria bacterium]
MKKLNIVEVKKKARELKLSLDKTAKKVEIIRAIQAAEGNSQCYGTGAAATCGQDKCYWRTDCLEA